MSKRKILIIDDNRDLSHALKLSLEQNGPFDIQVENDPLKARIAALKFHPELLLLDVIMPGKDGGTVAAEIRAEPSMKAIPVIFLTSILGKDEAALKGGLLGHDPVLAKPVTINELLLLIEKTLPA